MERGAAKQMRRWLATAAVYIEKRERELGSRCTNELSVIFVLKTKHNKYCNPKKMIILQNYLFSFGAGEHFLATLRTFLDNQPV